MATYQEATIQSSPYEIRQWTADFTKDLQTGVTVTAGTAYHIPPYGTALTPTITVGTPYILAQLGTTLVYGQHYLDVVATFSNLEVSHIRIAFRVGYTTPTAREGMLDLITTLRAMTDAGPNDYMVGGVPYWSDKQLQDILDLKRVDLQHIEMQALPIYLGGGTVQYKTYHLGYGNLESGTAAFTLEDATGLDIGTATYDTIDYNRGVVTFKADTGGSAMFITGHSYDLNGAAANVWRNKMASAAKLYDFSTDGHNLSRSQYMAHCKEMALYYAGQQEPVIMTIYREDNRDVESEE